MFFGKSTSIDDATDEYYKEYLVKIAEEKHAIDHKKSSNKEPMKIEVKFEETSKESFPILLCSNPSAKK